MSFTWSYWLVGLGTAKTCARFYVENAFVSWNKPPLHITSASSEKSSPRTKFVSTDDASPSTSKHRNEDCPIRKPPYVLSDLNHCHHHCAQHELNAAGHFEVPLPGLPEGDLALDIHPLFHEHNWIREDFSDYSHLWNDLKPALNLASRFLTEESSIPWWSQMLFAKKDVHRPTNRLYLQSYKYPACSKNTMRLRVMREFFDVQDRIKFVFANFQIEGLDGEMTRYLQKIDYDSGCLRPYDPWYQAPYHGNEIAFVGISSRFTDYFESGRRTHCQDVRTRWYLAVTLIHEIAHAVYSLKRGNEDIANGYNCEPCFDPSETEKDGELGWSLESYLFGGKVVANHVSSEFGCSELEFRPNNSPVGLAFPIKLEWFYGFFTEEKWQTLRASKNSRALLEVPKSNFCFRLMYYWSPHYITCAPDGKSLVLWSSYSNLVLEQYPLILVFPSMQDFMYWLNGSKARERWTI